MTPADDAVRYDEEPIESYLDALLLALPGSPRRVRRNLTEAEAHLHESAAARAAAGLDPHDAATTAVAEFGSPDVVARAHGLLLRNLIRPAALAGAVGMLAIALSGLVALGLRVLFGAHFLAGDLAGSTYDRARCADLIEYYPGHPCLVAAAHHHAVEVVVYRGLAGFVGLALLALWWFLPRTKTPPGLVAGTLAVSFAAASAVLAVATLNAAGDSWSGAGQWLSALAVTCPGAALCAVLWRRSVGPVRF